MGAGDTRPWSLTCRDAAAETAESSCTDISVPDSQNSPRMEPRQPLVTRPRLNPTSKPQAPESGSVGTQTSTAHVGEGS